MASIGEDSLTVDAAVPRLEPDPALHGLQVRRPRLDLDPDRRPHRRATASQARWSSIREGDLCRPRSSRRQDRAEATQDPTMPRIA